jgi:DNA-binding CsgD family transcriptional regulator/tetratricopeptide (TPR) repeat protein
VGRDAELAAAHAVVDRAVDGEAGLLLVGGEAGIGKTRLVEEVAAYARRRGMRVLSGRCVQLGPEGLPFAPIAEALRELVRETGRDRLPEVLGPARELVGRLVFATGDSAGERAPLATSQLLELALGLVERLSEDRPLLLVIEDLHWADQSTLELASFLAHNLRGVPVALVMTYRSDEVGRRHPLRTLLAAWERSRAILHLDLTRLNKDGVRAQLTGILGSAPDDRTLELVYDRSEGNAFLVEEMLSVVRSGDPRGLPPSLRDVLLARVDQLGPGAIRMLRLAAVAGRSVPERLLVAVSGLDEEAATAALREAVDVQLLVVDAAGYGYAFRHALARDAVYDDLLPGERVRLHTAYAEALSREPQLLRDTGASVAASLAYHAYAALDLPRAFEASMLAGREALAAMAPREALTQYERALQIWPRVPPAERPSGVDQAEVLELAGEAAYHAGDINRAASLLDEARAELPADAPAARRAHVLERCARAHRDAGRAAFSLELLLEALGLLPDAPMTAIRAEVLAALASSAMRGGRFVDGEKYARQVVETARQIDEPRIEADALVSQGTAQAQLSSPEDGIGAIRRGIELAISAGENYTALRGYVNNADLFEALGRSTEAAQTAEEGLALAQRVGFLGSIGGYLAGNLAESLLHLGDWERSRVVLDEAAAGGAGGVFEASIQLMRAELAMLTGDVDKAHAALARTRAQLIDPADDQFARPLSTVEADLARAAGAYDEARAIVLSSLASDTEQLSQRYGWPLVWTGVRAEVERSAGTGDVDPTLAAWAHSLGADTPPERAYRTMAAAELGEAAWPEACAAWRAMSWPWPLAYSLLRQAETEAVAGRRAAARAPLQESWTIATRLGARPLLAAAEQLAQRARVDIASVPAPAADPLAQLGLTGREREVLLLLAAGRSNPQIARELFISPKTASVHVSNILTKLGLSSRVQAAGVIHRLGLKI